MGLSLVCDDFFNDRENQPRKIMTKKHQKQFEGLVIYNVKNGSSNASLPWGDVHYDYKISMQPLCLSSWRERNKYLAYKKHMMGSYYLHKISQ